MELHLPVARMICLVTAGFEHGADVNNQPVIPAEYYAYKE